MTQLSPKKKIEDEGIIFWSSNGFAFETPGKHEIHVEITWMQEGIPYVVKALTEVWVDYPISDKDNEIASTLLHSSVGKIVALGGCPSHLNDGLEKIQAALKIGKNHAACKCIQRIIKLK